MSFWSFLSVALRTSLPPFLLSPLTSGALIPMSDIAPAVEDVLLFILAKTWNDLFVDRYTGKVLFAIAYLACDDTAPVLKNSRLKQPTCPLSDRHGDGQCHPRRLRLRHVLPSSSAPLSVVKDTFMQEQYGCPTFVTK